MQSVQTLDASAHCQMLKTLSEIETAQQIIELFSTASEQQKAMIPIATLKDFCEILAQEFFDTM